MRPGNILLAFVLPFAAAGSLFAQQEVIAVDSLPIVFYTDGVRLSTEGLYKEARGKFERVLETAPDHAPSLFEMASILATEGDGAAALEYSERAAGADPENIWYRRQKASLLTDTGRYDEAIALYKSMMAEGQRFDPDHYLMLAMLHYRNGHTDEAIATLDEAEVKMGRTSETVEMKRAILLEADRMEDAVRETEKYVAGSPYDEENRLALADMYTYQGLDSLGMATLKEVLEINPDNVPALVSLADLYLGKGQVSLYFATLKQLFMLDEVPLAKKIEQLDKLTANRNFYRGHFPQIGDLVLVLATHYPGNPEIIERYVDHMVRSGDAEGGLSMLKTQLRRSDKAPLLSSFMKAIEIEAYLKRSDSVALWSGRALALYPEAHEVYMLYSGAQQYMGQRKEARKTLVRAMKVAGTDSLRSELYGALGNLWHEEGNDRKTYANYEKALSYNSNNALVLNNYAYYLAVEGRDLDRALGMASRAVKLQENFATYLDTYAWLLYRLGDYAEAKRIMQQALPLDRDNNPELLLHYGDILRALGEDFMASVYWKRARDAGWEPASEIERRLAQIE